MKIKTYQIALVLLASVLLPVMLITALAQRKIEPVNADLKADVGVCKGNHRSRKDFYKNVRMFPPSTVLEIVGNRLNYATSEEGIELGSVELENGYSVVPKDFATNHSGCFGVTYCDIHKVVLLIERLDDKQCGLSKQ